MLLYKYRTALENLTVCLASLYFTNIHPEQQDNLASDVSSYYLYARSQNSTDRSDDRKS